MTQRGMWAHECLTSRAIKISTEVQAIAESGRDKSRAMRKVKGTAHLLSNAHHGLGVVKAVRGLIPELHNEPCLVHLAHVLDAGVGSCSGSFFSAGRLWTSCTHGSPQTQCMPLFIWNAETHMVSKQQAIMPAPADLQDAAAAHAETHMDRNNEWTLHAALAAGLP